MIDLLDKILTNPINKSILDYFELDKYGVKIPFFKSWADSYSGYDEGGIIFFEDYGEHISDNNKFTLSIFSIMVNEHSGEIFAFNKGRFSVFFKCNFIKSNTTNSDNLRKGYTFDCITDITELGEAWCFMNSFDNPKEQLKWAYEQTKNNEPPTQVLYYC
jgi:hypothetical protein